ncbi:MAG: glycosyltransferase, partial [Bacteroidota bacterium]|nr:glycosyltransferase [Bacteroidota bacterium]
MVCTYNGGNRLREVLSSIEQQEFAGNLELILVDNNSSPETVQIINDEINKMTVSARSVIEKQQGLQFARVKGFYEAKYDVVLMVDDDNFLSKNYVSEVFTAFQKDDTLGLVGGLGIARFEAEKPWWFDDYQINFAVGAQSNTLYGAGLGVRKKV